MRNDEKNTYSDDGKVFCQQCGAKIDENDVHCPNCGAFQGERYVETVSYTHLTLPTNSRV